jgi:hypothetical protein
MGHSRRECMMNKVDFTHTHLHRARLSFQCEPGCDVVLLLQDALVCCWRGRLAEPEPACLPEKLDFAFPFAAATVSLSLSLAHSYALCAAIRARRDERLHTDTHTRARTLKMTLASLGAA